MSIDKKAAPEPVDAGTNLTYTVDWTVGGNAYAYDVTIVDTLPADVTLSARRTAGLYDPAATHRHLASGQGHARQRAAPTRSS